MDIRFLFRRPGITPEVVSEAAGVHLSTAYRWKNGREVGWEHVTKLYARGLLTDDDLRAAGLAIRWPPGTPRRPARGSSPAPRTPA